MNHITHGEARELPKLPDYSPLFKPRWPGDVGGYAEEDLQAYGAACATHAREAALSEAMQACKQLETAIDGGGNTYYRPADARQCVSAIEALKGKR